MLLEFGFEVFQCVNNLFLLETLSFDDQSVLLWADVGHTKMVSGIEQFVGCKVTLCQAFDSGLSVEWLGRGW